MTENLKAMTRISQARQRIQVAAVIFPFLRSYFAPKATNQEGNLLTQVKSVLDQNGLNSSDNPDLNAAVCESDALIGLCTYQHDHPDFIAIARLLIENGANINAVDDRFRNSLLILCVEHLDADDLLDMTQFLIQNGIDFKARDKDGNSAAKILCIRGFSKESAIMRLLLRS